MFKHSSQSASVISPTRPDGLMPALLNRTSGRAELADRPLDHPLNISLAGDIRLNGDRRPAAVRD